MRVQRLLSIHRRVSALSLLGVLASLGLLLGACGFTDDLGTNYSIVLGSETYEEDDTLAPIGMLDVDEVATVTFEVTVAEGLPMDRTAQASFELVDRHTDDDASDFVFTLSSDLESQPYHTMTSSVDQAKVTLCATYDGPETTGGPLETCRRVVIHAREAAD